MDLQDLRGLIIADFTVDQLAVRLGSPNEFPSIRSKVAPFDQVQQVLLNPADPSWETNPNVVVIWTRPENVSSEFRASLEYAGGDPAKALEQVDQFADLIAASAGRAEAIFVPTWAVTWSERGLGAMSMSSASGVQRMLLAMNLRLAEKLDSVPNVFLLDTNAWIAKHGKTSVNPKLWLMAKMAFSPEILREAASDVKSTLLGLTGKSKKLLVLDLDDTMWGGIVGETGWEGLALGGHDPVGESFVQFQKAVKRLTRTGVILGICSKNDEDVALEAIDNHPEMVLRRQDFAGWKINWRDKATNIAELVEELNLGIDSVVFIDDNPAERARVRESLPKVFVPEWPEDKLLYTQALQQLRCFDRHAVTAEDTKRTEMYRAERERQTMKESMTSIEDWMMSLDLKIQVEPLSDQNLKRATQLLNKTNQLNLRTRRLTEEEFLQWASHPDHAAYCFRVEDRFGDYGLTGIASVTKDGFVEDFLLSCRVMGRGVEKSMLAILGESARRAGGKGLRLEYLETERNRPVQSFLAKESGLMVLEGDTVYGMDLVEEIPGPPHVTFIMEDNMLDHLSKPRT